MATATGTFSSYPSLLTLRVECYKIQDDSGNNRSLVRADAYIDFSGGSATSYNNTVSLNINGSGGSWNIGTQSYSGSGPRLVVGGFDVWVGHDANGYLGSVGFSGSASTGGWGSASCSNSVGGFQNYDRTPGAPTFTTLSRTANTVSVAVSSVSSPASAATYYIQRSENGGGWGDTRTGQSATFSSLTLGTSQQFRTYATNSDGTGGITYSSTVSIPTVPSSPASVNVVSVAGTDIGVTVGASGSTGGDPITGYSVQWSTNGTTWSTPISVSPGVQYVYSGLTPGLFYTFRAYSTNSVGNSATATSSPFLLTAGGKRWNGTDFVVNTVAKRWTGSAWVTLTTVKRWNGTAWVDVS